MAGLLGDVLPWVYSQGDRAKRFLGGLLSDPVGSAQQTAGLLGDKHREMQALQAQAFPDQSRPFKVGDSKAMGQMAEAMLTGPLGFAPVGMFIGPNAKTWDKTAAQLAQKLDASGVDPRAIWKETGTFKGPDGKWRQEIDDSVADVPRYGKHILRPLEEAMLHEPLEAAYPSVKNIMFETVPGSVRSGAEYRPSVKFHQFGDRESIVIRNSEESAKQNKSLALHELQHAIQQREGFAKGGSPDAMRGSSDVAQLVRVLEARADAAREAGDKAAYMAATDARAKLLREDGYGAYKNLAGEAEARATQARMNMGMQQRRDLFPLDSYDVPVDQLILR